MRKLNWLLPAAAVVVVAAGVAGYLLFFRDAWRPPTVAVLHAFYREYLQREIPVLIAKWQPHMKVDVAAWGVKRMKTRWGSCNIRARRIWLNLELVKHSAACLEYVVVHEMVHLLERSHNERFKKLMDTFLPHWRLLKAELNRSVPGHVAEAC